MAAEKSVIDVKDQDFESVVLNSDIPVLVDFWAPWCGPCRMAAPIVDKVAQNYQGKLKVCKLNVDEGKKTAAKYAVMSIPTLYLYKGGKVVDKLSGITTSFETDLRKKIDPLI